MWPVEAPAFFTYHPPDASDILPPVGATPMPILSELTDQSGFVFEGKIDKVGATSATTFAATPATVVVDVTKILKSPSSLAGYTGMQVTVELKPPVSLKAGDSAVFFTHGIHYGDGLVVQEVDNMPPDTNMEANVTSAIQTNNDAELTQRLAQSDLVITGTASAPKPWQTNTTAAPGGLRRVSEHDPDWMVATITVEKTEKGADTGPSKDIIFANSTDVAWHLSPKVKEGDHGTFLLHSKDQYGRSVPALAVVHPSDFHPIAQVARIRSLLQK
jgi:hypothetical protein